MAITVFDRRKYEIVAGQPEKTMGGARHGGIGVRLATRPTASLEAQCGDVLNTSFQVGPNERLPDLAFIARPHPPEGEPEGIWPFCP
jgi:hypothetical protein